MGQRLPETGWRRNEELLFNGSRVSLWDDEKDRNGW